MKLQCPRKLKRIEKYYRPFITRIQCLLSEVLKEEVQQTLLFITLYIPLVVRYSSWIMAGIPIQISQYAITQFNIEL